MEYTRNNYTIQGKITSNLILDLIDKINSLERTTKINKISNENKISVICEIYKDLLEVVFLAFYEDLTEGKTCIVVESTISEKVVFKKILLKLIVYVRDISYGFGKYDLYYRLIGVYCMTLDKVHYIDNKRENSTTILYDNLISYLKTIISSTVILNDDDADHDDADHDHEDHDDDYDANSKPYGSWKDMKYILNHLRDIYGEKELLNKEIFKYIIELICFQLKKDVIGNTKFSLVAKWIPREKSKKFGWQNKYIAISFATDCYDLTEYINKNVPNKCRIGVYCSNLRRIIACINKIIQTPQINQCNNSWSLIDFNNVSKITLEKQNNAFKYQNKYGIVKGLEKDRLNCRINHMKYENDNCISVNISNIKQHNNEHNNEHTNEHNKYKSEIITTNVMETLELKWKKLICILFNNRYKNIDLNFI